MASLSCVAESLDSPLHGHKRRGLKGLDCPTCGSGHGKGGRGNIVRQLGRAGEAIPEGVCWRLEAEEASAVQRIENELASLLPSGPAADAAPILAVLADLDWRDLTWEGWRQVLTLLVRRILLYGLGDFLIEWQPAAEILRSAVDRVPRLGSDT